MQLGGALQEMAGTVRHASALGAKLQLAPRGPIRNTSVDVGQVSSHPYYFSHGVFIILFKQYK